MDSVAIQGEAAQTYHPNTDPPTRDQQRLIQRSLMKVSPQAEAMLVPLDQLNRTTDNLQLMEIYINRSLHPTSKAAKISRS